MGRNGKMKSLIDFDICNEVPGWVPISWVPFLGLLLINFVFKKNSGFCEVDSIFVLPATKVV